VAGPPARKEGSTKWGRVGDPPAILGGSTDVDLVVRPPAVVGGSTEGDHVGGSTNGGFHDRRVGAQTALCQGREDLRDARALVL